MQIKYSNALVTVSTIVTVFAFMTAKSVVSNITVLSLPLSNSSESNNTDGMKKGGGGKGGAGGAGGGALLANAVDITLPWSLMGTALMVEAFLV
jgi:hypothetical protein